MSEFFHPGQYPVLTKTMLLAVVFCSLDHMTQALLFLRSFVGLGMQLSWLREKKAGLSSLHKAWVVLTRRDDRHL